MRYLPALIVDAVLVLIFAVIGRASHQEDPAGFLLTAWPFLVALVLGHALAALLPARPRRPWSLGWGVVVWIVTVVGGMLLRLASGATAEVPFIIVATLVLGVFLVGWRGIAALLRRSRGSSHASERPQMMEPSAATDQPETAESSDHPDAPRPELRVIDDEGPDASPSDAEDDRRS